MTGGDFTCKWLMQLSNAWVAPIITHAVSHIWCYSYV